MEETREVSLVISRPEEGKFLEHIDWNKQEFLELIQSAMERYKGVTFTEDQVKEAKEERARLNALKKAIADRRIQIKKAVLAPYTQFETEVGEVTALIDEPIAEIDRQIKAFEEKQKEQKRETLRKHFEGIVADLSGILTFEQVFDKRYLNATVTLAKAKRDITDKVKRVREDLKTVESVEEEYRPIVRDVYQKTLDIGKAMSEMYRLKELKRQEEARKAAREAAEREAAAAREAAERAEAAEEEPPKSVPTPAEVRAAEPQPPAIPPASGSDTSAPPAQDPFITPPKAKQYKASFTVYGTRDQILSVRKFMIDHGIKFEKGVK